MATLKDVMEHTRITGESLADFRKQWEALTEVDKQDLKDWTDAAMASKGAN